MLNICFKLILISNIRSQQRFTKCKYKKYVSEYSLCLVTDCNNGFFNVCDFTKGLFCTPIIRRLDNPCKL